MRTEKQLKQLEEARKHIKNREHSEETKKKISQANDGNFFAKCDYCEKEFHTKKSSFNKSKRHFCCMECYSKYRSEKMPKEEQPAYGSGLPEKEREKRIKARTIFHHYMRDNNLERQPCEICGEIAEAHHDDYDKPLEVRWLCTKHHKEWHKQHKDADLLDGEYD